MDYTLRPMVVEDLPQVTEIEQESFPHPWSEDYFHHELTANRIARYLVVCQAAVVLGYIGLWLIVGEIHITTLASHERHRRQGIADLLLISAIELAQEHNARFITLEVRESNLAARALYTKYGFAEGGIRHRYYSETGEDAVIMSTENITSASFRDHFHRLKQAHARKHKLRLA